MSQTFRLREPDRSVPVPAPFGLGGSGVPSFECLRLLAGALDLEHSSTGGRTKLRYCFLTQKNRHVASRAVSKIIETVFDNALDRSDVERFLRKSSGENRIFWEELRAELSFCLFARKKNQSIEAFLHLYRILELISVALPLVYASSISDFRKAVVFIKSLSKNDRDQDLAILKYFSEEISKSSGMYSQLEVDFPFKGMEKGAAKSLVDQLNRYIFFDGKIKNSFYPMPEEGVRVNFDSVPSFIVMCRNRLFHNAMTNENFKLDPLRGAGGLCSVLVDPALYWLGIIFSEILKAQASRYV